MEKISIKQGKENDLDLIQTLWEKLNQLHFELSPDFKNRFNPHYSSYLLKMNANAGYPDIAEPNFG